MSHDFLCVCPSLTHVRSLHAPTAGGPHQSRGVGYFFTEFARKLERSHPGVMVALPTMTRRRPGRERGDYMPVETWLLNHAVADEIEEVIVGSEGESEYESADDG